MILDATHAQEIVNKKTWTDLVLWALEFTKANKLLFIRPPATKQ